MEMWSSTQEVTYFRRENQIDTEVILNVDLYMGEYMIY